MATDPELLRSTLEDQLALLREQLLVDQGLISHLRAENLALVADKEATGKVLEALRVRVDELERKLSRNSGNSSKPPSSDTLTEKAVIAARRRSPKRGKA